ncbi:MAG: hypothetical protein RQ751_00305 [Longimicrobiales bacterium]|nr:hypothetical protein [Longimicrobiales bacterium]
MLALAALTVTDARPAEGQQRRPPAPPPARAEMEAQVQRRFHELVVRELALTEEQAVGLQRVVESFREQRRELNRRQRLLQRRMAGTGALLSEEEARQVLEEVTAVKELEVRLLREEQVALREVVSAPQLVRFYTLREQLAGRIRRLRQPGGGGSPDGGGTPGGGGGPPGMR